MEALRQRANKVNLIYLRAVRTWERGGAPMSIPPPQGVGGHARSPRNPNGFTGSEVMGRRFYFFLRSGVYVGTYLRTHRTNGPYIYLYLQTNKQSDLFANGAHPALVQLWVGCGYTRW